MASIFTGKHDIYIEVAQRYENFIRLGVLKDGDKLPSVRVAAGELGVNPNTVQKAYSYLEEKGLIRSLPKKGAFVTYPSGTTTPTSRQEIILTALISLKEQGISKNEITSLLKEVFDND